MKIKITYTPLENIDNNKREVIDTKDVFTSIHNLSDIFKVVDYNNLQENNVSAKDISESDIIIGDSAGIFFKILHKSKIN